MDSSTFADIEKYMCSCMSDAAHDKQHVYRVLYNAVEIAKTERGVNYDVLIAACLLHDIGRKEQFEDPSKDHAEVGAQKARAFLIGRGEDDATATAVADCIKTHRFRKDRAPQSLEAKILFDADKLDVTGAMGIARTLVYKGTVNDPLYSVDKNGMPTNGENECAPSFFQEYNFKLKNLYSRFYTERGAQIAQERQAAARDFYDSLYAEVRETYTNGMTELKTLLTE